MLLLLREATNLRLTNSYDIFDLTSSAGVSTTFCRTHHHVWLNCLAKVLAWLNFLPYTVKLLCNLSCRDTTCGADIVEKQLLKDNVMHIYFTFTLQQRLTKMCWIHIALISYINSRGVDMWKKASKHKRETKRPCV